MRLPPHTPRSTLWTALALAGTLAAPAWAGPLFPPDGEPAPTMKRLDQVSTSRCISTLPAFITEPGTYDLCGNLTGGAGKAAITVAVSGVVLDLKGFTLSGTPEAQSGIEVLPDAGTVTIRNGTVRGFPQDGIRASRYASIAQLTNLRCEDLRVTDCGGDGISMAGGIVERCLVTSCANGIVFTADGPGGKAVATDVRTTSNSGSGIVCVDLPFDFSRCVSTTNVGSGIVVQLTGGAKAQDYNSSRSNITTCTGNNGDGFTLLAGEGVEATLDFESCVWSGNTGKGVNVVCGPQEKVTVSVSGSEANNNGEEGLSVRNALALLGDSVCQSNGSHGVRLTSDSPAKAQDYNSSRSNNINGASLGDNDGDGILIESLFTGAISVIVVGSSSNSNTGNGVGCVGNVSVEVQRCVLSGNDDAGLRMSSTDPGGVCRADVRDTRMSSNTGGGVACPELGGAADVRLADTRIDRCGDPLGGVGGGAVHVSASPSTSSLALSLERCVVSDCPGDGVSFDARAPGGADPAPSSCAISSSSIDRCSGNGAVAYGRTFAMSSSHVRGNGGGGLLCGNTDHFLFASSVVTGNSATGLDVDCPVVEITDSTCASNTGTGASLACASMSVRGSTFSNNQGGGLTCLSGAGQVSGCVVSSNGERGIDVHSSGLDLSDNVISGHRSAIGDGAGIRILSPGNRVVGNFFDDCDDAVALFANDNPMYQNSTNEGVNPLFEDEGVSGNSGPNSPIDAASNPFSNIVPALGVPRR